MHNRNPSSQKKKGFHRFLPNPFKKAEPSSNDNPKSSLNPSVPTSQRSSLSVRSAPGALGQHRSTDPPISQVASRNETAAPPVARDIDDTLAGPNFPVPMILINNEVPQSSFNPTSVTSHIQTRVPISASPSVLHDELNTPTLAGPIAAVATIDNPAPALASDQLGSKVAPLKTASAKDNLKLTGRFLQTVITRIPEVIGPDPVKMAFSIAKVIIDVKKNVAGNMDTVERRIMSIAEQLEIMESLLGRWEPKTEEEKVSTERLNRVFQNESENLIQLKKESILRKIVDYEDEKSRIADIFERVNEARIQFRLATDLRIFKVIHAIEANHRRTLLKDLKPSKLANHKYHLEGQKKKVLQRAVCTTGTRERVLNEIVTWAKGSSSETIYWLFGRAGTGKTTIAYTIARRFELATSDDIICLGGNFFSSQQFEETRLASHIVRTIVYHLTLRCKAFADALTNTGDFDTVHQNVRAQLDALLVGPWQKSEPARLADSSPHYLIAIDALDEIEGTGGSDFLRDLLDTINKNHLSGLKFFVTSRPDRHLVDHVETFTNKQLYCLEEVPLEEAGADIKTYLNVSLPHAEPRYINNVVTSAAGLFIYASTIVRYIGRHIPFEQNKLLEKFFGVSAAPKMTLDATSPLDKLYNQIVVEAFGEFEEEILQHRLHIFFIFLCASERLPTSTATQLFSAQISDSTLNLASEINGSIDTSVADDILEHLHAVLYVENNKVLWHHKSFPDFLFDQTQSKNFWCDQHKHHQLLLHACFSIMKAGLQFNIAGIESSFVVDIDDKILPESITKNIAPTLSYACQKWNTHLHFIEPSEMALFCKMILEFLQIRALFWMEVMNLLELPGHSSGKPYSSFNWL